MVGFAGWRDVWLGAGLWSLTLNFLSVLSLLRKHPNEIADRGAG